MPLWNEPVPRWAVVEDARRLAVDCAAHASEHGECGRRHTEISYQGVHRELGFSYFFRGSRVVLGWVELQVRLIEPWAI